MNEILVWTGGVALLLLGAIGSFLPVLPGPVIGYAALWLAWLLGFSPGRSALVWGAVAVGAAALIDYVLPTYFAKKFKCSKRGVFACFVGTLVGLFFLPWGLVLGPVVGTVVGELSSGKTFVDAAKGGFGAFCGFVSCLLIKLASVGLFAWWFVKAVT